MNAGNDAALRALERTFRATGSAEDGVAWLLARVRAGDLAPERLELAAYLEHAAARQASVALGAEAPAPPAEVRAWLRRLAAWGDRVAVHGFTVALEATADVPAAARGPLRQLVRETRAALAPGSPAPRDTWDDAPPASAEEMGLRRLCYRLAEERVYLPPDHPEVETAVRAAAERLGTRDLARIAYDWTESTRRGRGAWAHQLRFRRGEDGVWGSVQPVAAPGSWRPPPPPTFRGAPPGRGLLDRASDAVLDVGPAGRRAATEALLDWALGPADPPPPSPPASPWW